MILPSMTTQKVDLGFLSCPRNTSWNFAGFIILELKLNHFITRLISVSSLITTLSRQLSPIYRLLSSAKLQTSFSLRNKNISFMNLLNKIGPSIDPCGTPRTISIRSLKYFQCEHVVFYSIGNCLIVLNCLK